MDNININYSLRNILIASNEEYEIKLAEKTEQDINKAKRMRKQTYHYFNNNKKKKIALKIPKKKVMYLKRCSLQHKLLINFKKDQIDSTKNH